MRRPFATIAALFMALVLMAPANALAQQSVNIFVGGFSPSPDKSRDRNDVIYQNGGFLAFDVRDFEGATVGAEWLVGLGENFDAGLGAGIYSRTVPSVYAALVNSNKSEIRQNMKLRVAPFTATFRWLPLGRHDAFEPYLGAGVAVYSWRYSESGQFVDTRDNSIFSGDFAASGSATGPVILGGVRVPIGAVGIGGEVRYQGGTGNLPGNQGFSGSKIDLGGFNYLLTFNVRF